MIDGYIEYEYIARVGSASPSYNLCVASIILDQSIFMYGLIFGVHAMMVQRVCAMYGMAQNVRIFLTVCFATVQVVNAVAFITIMSTMYYVGNSLQTCTWAFPAVTSIIIISSRCARAGLETILLGMALYQTVVHLRDRFRGTQFNLDTFVTILARDHIFYVVVASMSWTVDASSFLGTYPEALMGNGPWLIFLSVVSVFCVSMLGPIMILSILRFDDERVRGEMTNGVHEIELTSIHFAAGRGHSQLSGPI